MTVIGFTGVDTSGSNGSGAVGAFSSANASSGPPSASLCTTRANSWVVGVGNDYDNPIARTPGPWPKPRASVLAAGPATVLGAEAEAPTLLRGRRDIQ